MPQFRHLAYQSAEQMMFGRALYPVECGFDLNIGNGLVHPEINYTLPPMSVSYDTLDEVLSQYGSMVESILGRLVELQAPGVVLEFEHTPQMTTEVEIGVRVTEQTKRQMQQYHDRFGLKSALRVTVCDIRETERPPKMRSGAATETLFEAFRRNAEAGADLLSVESTGGKEVSDQALLEGDIPAILLALGVLAPRDMEFIWENICRIASDCGAIATGDTACGFANTAMVLADRQYIPAVLAAVVRAMSAVRSLVAFEMGAIGPSKDCAYEGPILKAITGYPISMEGKTSACAHFSHVGNIAAAVCDLWSNESVQNVRLLSGYAPEVFAEILAYDCRLMNQATEQGSEETLKQLFTDSDRLRSPHALIISPDASFEIGSAIVSEADRFQKTRVAGLAACQLLREAIHSECLAVPARELTWLDSVERSLSEFTTEETLVTHCKENSSVQYIGAEYGL